MGEFLVQFLSQAWRLVAIIAFLIVLAIIAWRREKANREKKIQQRRAEQEALVANTKPRPAQSPQASNAVDDLDFEPVTAGGSIFDDDDIFADDDPLPPTPQPDTNHTGSLFDDGDIFTDTDNEPIATSVPTPETQPSETEAPTPSFADLLAEQPAQPARDYHQISITPVAIQLNTKDLTLATEVLSISRDERDKRLMVQIEDKAYRTLLDTPDVRKHFTATMKALTADVLKPDTNPDSGVDIAGASIHTISKDPINVQVASGGETTALEMLSIMTDEADGHYLVQIGKTGFRTISGNDRAKKVFAKIMKELSTVVLTADDNPPHVATQEPDISAISPNAFALDIDDEEEIPGDLRFAKMDEMPDAYEVGRFGRVKVKKVEDKVEELDIAGAIEAYLQFKIKHTPEFQQRGIHIRSAFGGGVRIEIEGRTYEFVDEVEPPEARAFIQQAITEWQERH